jgi:TatD DNase family protein
MQVQWVDFHTHQLADNDKISLYNWMIDENMLPAVTYCSAGIHPWYIVPEHLDEQFARLEERIKLPGVLAVGECGLDKLRGPSSELQEKVFVRQAELSEKYQKPLILHCVKRYSEVLNLKKQLKPAQPWIFHGFGASNEVMLQAENDGFLFSFSSSSLVFGSKANDALRHVSPDKLFLETDESTLGIEELYQSAALIRQVSVDVLKQLIYSNFQAIFPIS